MKFPKNTIVSISSFVVALGLVAVALLFITPQDVQAKDRHLPKVLSTCTLSTAPVASGTYSSPLEAAPVAVSGNLIQIAFLLDTSSSMDGLIEQAKSRLWSILNQITKAKRAGETPRIEVSLYEYGNDGLAAKDNFIRQVVALTTDVDEFSDKLFGLRTNGGAEYCGAVLARSFKELAWSSQQQAVKLVYIAGNEPFTQGPTDPYQAISNACETGISVTTIYCGSIEAGRQSGWALGAEKCGGDYFNIDQDQATVYIASPYDEAIEKANSGLNRTYIPYGVNGKVAAENQSRQDANAAGIDQANLVSRAMYKVTTNYSNGHWDLVDAYTDDPEVIEKKEQLPADMRELSAEEIRARIIDFKDERRALQAEILRLSELRDAFVAQERAKEALGVADNSLGERINASVRKYLVAKGYLFE